MGESANKAQQLPMPHSSRGQKRMMKINATTAKVENKLLAKQRANNYSDQPAKLKDA